MTQRKDVKFASFASLARVETFELDSHFNLIHILTRFTYLSSIPEASDVHVPMRMGQYLAGCVYSREKHNPPDIAPCLV